MLNFTDYLLEESLGNNHESLFHEIKQLLTLKELTPASIRLIVINDILKNLNNCSSIHFACEEAILKLLDYPEEHLNHHVTAHRDFKSYLANIYRARNDLDKVAELANRLEEWLLLHIENYDSKASEFIILQKAKLRE